MLRNRVEEPAADKMAMLQRTEVTCTEDSKQYRDLSLLSRHVVILFPPPSHLAPGIVRHSKDCMRARVPAWYLVLFTISEHLI